MTWRKGHIPGWDRESTTWTWNIMIKESKIQRSLLDGLPRAKLREFEHQNKYGNEL